MQGCPSSLRECIMSPMDMKTLTAFKKYSRLDLSVTEVPCVVLVDLIEGHPRPNMIEIWQDEMHTIGMINPTGGLYAKNRPTAGPCREFGMRVYVQYNLKLTKKFIAFF